jgi:MFS family permease
LDLARLRCDLASVAQKGFMSFPHSSRTQSRFAVLTENRRISVAVFVDTVGAGLLLPLSLVYFTLTTGLGLPAIGLIAASATVVALPAGLVGGAITDRFGAKASMVTNNLISAVGYTLFLFVHEPVGVFVAILLTAASERLYWASWMAYVHQLAAGRSFERWFSFLEAMKMGAMGLGAIISALVLAADAVTGLRWLVLANVISSVVAATIFSGQKLPASAASSPATVIAGRRGVRLWGDVFRGRGSVALTIGQFLLGPIMVLPNVALSVLFISIWHLPTAVAPAMFATNTVLVAALQAPLTGAMVRISRTVRIWIAVLLVVACTLPLAFVPALGGTAGWLYVFGTGIVLALADILYLPPTNAIMVEAPAPHLRGRAVSVFQTAFALSMALYPATIGLLHSRTPWLLWAMTAAAAAGGALCYSIAVRQLPEHGSR